MSEPVYESRLVLYTDILGWKAATGSGDPAALLEAIRALHRPAEDHNERERTRLVALGGRGGITVNPMYLAVQFGAFSDNIVLSMPAAFGTKILTTARSLVIELLRSGFLVRGAVNLGDLHHRDNVVFGPALNEAVRLEQCEAEWPRILVSDEAARHIQKMPIDPSYQPMISDQTGRLVVNPFYLGFDGPEDVIRSAVMEGFFPREIDAVIAKSRAELEAQGQQKQAEKWAYMRAFIDGPVFTASPKLHAAWTG